MSYSARTTDPVTSHLAAIESPERVAQRDRILLAFYFNRRRAMTDEQASQEAGVSPRSCWWRRCSELREDGLIFRVADESGNSIQVKGSQGRPVHASIITGVGTSYLRSKGLL